MGQTSRQEPTSSPADAPPPIWRFQTMAHQHGVLHLVSGRRGGLSPAPWDSLNLSFRMGDEAERVVENRHRVLTRLGVDLGDLVCGQQVHQTHIQVVQRADRGRGARDFDSAFPATDGMVTNDPGVCLMVLGADCTPILAYDPVHHAIGAAHAGWRGTVAGMAESLVDALRKAYGTNPRDLVCGIGPSIGPDDYEVGNEVVAAFRERFGASSAAWTKPSPHGRSLLNLWLANRDQLLEAGVSPKNVEIMGISTFSAVDDFFSERRDGAPTGRFGAAMVLH